MAFTPYPNGDNDYENPSIVASSDGSSWEEPSGISNPIDADPGDPAYNNDVDLFYDSSADELWCYWLEAGSGTTYVYRSESSDGTTWSAQTEMFNVTDFDVISPSVLKVGSTYYMWSINSGSDGSSGQSNTIEVRTSSDGATWGAASTCTFSQAGYIPWHIDVIYVSDTAEYWMLVSAYKYGDSATSCELFFARSTDTTTWTTYYNKCLRKGGSGWDNFRIYRASLLYDGTTLEVWYSAQDTNLDWYIGYTSKTYTDFLSDLDKMSARLQGTSFIQ
jgi:hypothetical protein